MAMSLCYQYTHPTVALILKHVTQRPRTVSELAEKLGMTLSHVRDTCLWMHKRKIIRIEMWIFEYTRGGPATRLFGPAGPGSAPDAVKPKSKRKRRRAADKRKKLPPIIQTEPDRYERAEMGVFD